MDLCSALSEVKNHPLHLSLGALVETFNPSKDDIAVLAGVRFSYRWKDNAGSRRRPLACRQPLTEPQKAPISPQTNC